MQKMIGRRLTVARFAPIACALLVLFTTVAAAQRTPSSADTKKACGELTKADELLRRRATDEKKSSKDSAKAESLRAVGDKESAAARKNDELERSRENAQQKFTVDMVVGGLQAALGVLAVGESLPSHQGVAPSAKIQPPSRLTPPIQGASALGAEASKACGEGKTALAAAKTKEALALLQPSLAK